MFSAKTAAKLADISPRALSYWTNNQTFTPYKSSPVAGVAAKYTKEDVLVLTIVQRLKSGGAHHDFARRILAFLNLNRHLLNSSWLVIQDGLCSKPSSVYEVASIVEDQGGWVIHLDHMREELGLRILSHAS